MGADNREEAGSLSTAKFRPAQTGAPVRAVMNVS
jgi:hypothetical protein